MFKIFKNRKDKARRDVRELIIQRLYIREQMKELEEMDKVIHEQLDELEETIRVAEAYLSLCGYSKKDLEDIKRKSKIRIVK